MGFIFESPISIWHAVGPVTNSMPGTTVQISSSAGALGTLAAFWYELPNVGEHTETGDIVRVTGTGFAEWDVTQRMGEGPPTADIGFMFNGTTYYIPTLPLPFGSHTFSFSFLFLLTFRQVLWLDNVEDEYGITWKADGHVLICNEYQENWMLENTSAISETVNSSRTIDIEATITFRGLVNPEFIRIRFEQCVVEYMRAPYDSSDAS
jgi:hypothetical protein